MERWEMKRRAIESDGGSAVIEVHDAPCSDDVLAETAPQRDTDDVLAEVPELRGFYEMHEREAAELDEELVSAVRLPTKVPRLGRLVFDIVRDIEPEYLRGLEDLLEPELACSVRTLGERARTLSYALLYERSGP